MSRSRMLITLALVVLMSVPVGSAMAQEPVLISAGGEGTAVVWDDQSLSDAITYTMTGVTPPGEGKQYVGWLVSDDGATKLNTGVLTVGDDGAVTQTFDSNSSRYTGENLIGAYSRVAITEEAAGSDLDAPAGSVVFSHAIPVTAMTHIRHLLADSPDASGAGILTNLKTQLGVAIQHAELASKATTIAALKKQVEQIVNVIEGPTGANYGDLDGDGTVSDPGDGKGILSHAINRVSAGLAADAAPNDTAITAHAALVEAIAGHAATLVEQARDAAVKYALPQGDLNIAKLLIANIAGLLGNAMDGIDADADGTITATAEEGGASQAYVEAQLMATYTMVPGEALPPEPEPPTTVGDTFIPLMAQMALVAAVLLLGTGGVLLLRGRRTRV